jgi:putative transposase
MRIGLVTKDGQPSIRPQCHLLGVNRSSLYYTPVADSDEELMLMREIDELHLQRPFYGSRKIASTLKTKDRSVNRSESSA